MKYGINKATLVGNVGETPRFTEHENTLKTTFPFATSETYKDKDGNEVTKTEWHRCVAWNRQAEILNQYVKKGDSLYIEGKITNSSWEDNSQNTHYRTEIVVENFLFLKTKKPENNE